MGDTRYLSEFERMRCMGITFVYGQNEKIVRRTDGWMNGWMVFRRWPIRLYNTTLDKMDTS